jgi:type II secretory pathway pseudopilin PulG
MKNLNIKTKNGFSILAIILVIVAVVSAIGIWALSGKSNTSNSGDASNSLLASSLIQDSSSFKLAYDTLQINGTSNIVFVPGLNAANNILDAKTGVEYSTPSSNVIRTGATAPEGKWVYMTQFYSGANLSQADIAVVVAGVKDTVCKQINKTLYGSDYIPAYTTVTTGAGFVTGATPAAPTSTFAIDFNSIAEFKNLPWTVGCIAASGNLADHNLFYRVIKIN